MNTHTRNEEEEEEPTAAISPRFLTKRDVSATKFIHLIPSREDRTGPSNSHLLSLFPLISSSSSSPSSFFHSHFFPSPPLSSPFLISPQSPSITQSFLVHPFVCTQGREDDDDFILLLSPFFSDVRGSYKRGKNTPWTSLQRPDINIAFHFLCLLFLLLRILFTMYIPSLVLPRQIFLFYLHEDSRDENNISLTHFFYSPDMSPLTNEGERSKKCCLYCIESKE